MHSRFIWVQRHHHAHAEWRANTENTQRPGQDEVIRYFHLHRVDGGHGLPPCSLRSRQHCRWQQLAQRTATVTASQLPLVQEHLCEHGPRVRPCACLSACHNLPMGMQVPHTRTSDRRCPVSHTLCGVLSQTPRMPLHTMKRASSEFRHAKSALSGAAQVQGYLCSIHSRKAVHQAVLTHQRGRIVERQGGQLRGERMRRVLSQSIQGGQRPGQPCRVCRTDGAPQCLYIARWNA